ncbi:MAG TPA: EAL domain-containing protein [Candidatus Limnocylindria bacterium]|nr:EAL domain-containing protein [Candidatus Limnocylindria bacterium]
MTFGRAELRTGLDRGELFVLYQAQVDLRTGALTGLECAIRWQHPERGVIHAVKFVDDIPPSGLAPDFMRFMTRTTTRQVAAWRTEGIAIPRYSINVWPIAVGRGLIDDMLAAAKESAVDVATMEIETQPEATYDAAMLGRLREFRQAGIRVALDDFGEGSLHFGWLRDAPFDVVKIPVMFGKNAGRAYDDAIIASAVAFARAIGAVTVIEGVESLAIRDRSRELGCDIGQGYLWSQQVRAAELPKTLSAITIDGAATT